MVERNDFDFIALYNVVPFALFYSKDRNGTEEIVLQIKCWNQPAS